MKKKKIPIVMGGAPIGSRLWVGSVTVAEQRRQLEQDVLNAAALWRQDWLMNSHALRDAVDALDAFEMEATVRRAEVGVLTRTY